MLLKSLLQFILLSLNFILTMVISLSAPKCLDAWMYSCYLAFKHIFGSQIFYLTRRRHAFVFEKQRWPKVESACLHPNFVSRLGQHGLRCQNYSVRMLSYQ